MSDKESTNPDPDDLPELRPQEETILQAIADGHDDIHRLNQHLALSKRQINYAITEKLQPHGYITVTRPDGTVTRRVNGQQRTFPAPKQVALTPQADQYLTTHTPATATYTQQDLDALTQRVAQTEQDIANLEAAFEAFRKQVLDALRDHDT